MIEAFTTFARNASPPVFLGVAVASGIVIFSGENVAASLGVDQFRTAYRGELGIAFLVSVSVFVATSIWSVSAFVNKRIIQRAETKQKAENAKLREEERKRSLHELTPDEKAYLIPYVVDEQNTQYFLIEDGVAGGLQAKGIIYRSSNVGSMLEGWAFNIQPWARTYLKEHPDLLSGANPSPQGPPTW